MTRTKTSKASSRLSNFHDKICDWRLSILLALSIVLGGTSQFVLSLKIPLYFVSAAFIAHAILTRRNAFSRLWSPSVILGFMLIVLFGLYLIPLPSEVWSELAGRENVVQSFALIGAEKPWLPLSLRPEITFLSLLDFLPLCAVALIMGLSAKSLELTNAEKTIIVISLVSLLVGLIDILLNIHIFSVYEFYDKRFPVGVFTNINHQATLMALSLPLAIFYAHDFKRNRRHQDMKVTTFGIFASIILTLGLILSQSIAGYFFLIFNITLAVFFMNAGRRFSKLLLLPVLVLVLALFLNVFVFDNQLEAALIGFTSDSATARPQVFSTSIETARSYGLFGAGPGSFDTVYQFFESRETLSPIFVNSAHNEYLELWIELGVIGLIWIALGLIWFFRHAVLLLKTKSSRWRKGRIYLLCILTVIIHSIVDYPLRTMAVGTIFAFLVIRLDQFSESYT